MKGSLDRAHALEIYKPSVGWEFVSYITYDITGASILINWKNPNFVTEIFLYGFCNFALE